MRDAPGGGRAALQDRWLALTRATLPALANERRWPIRADHCFQRVLLDAACDGCWYDHIAARPAYAHAPDAVLARAVALADAVVAGTADLVALNRQSLAWRQHGRAPGARDLKPARPAGMAAADLPLE